MAAAAMLVGMVGMGACFVPPPVVVKGGNLWRGKQGTQQCSRCRVGRQDGEGAPPRRSGKGRVRRPNYEEEEYEGFVDESESFYGRDDAFAYEPGPRPRAVARGPFGVPLLPERLSKALLAGIFVLGIGTGVTVDSAINTNPKDLASRDAIDRNAPNPLICQTYGSSAMVLDQRVFVTFNPFSIHVAPADAKPGCVLNPANVVEVLQRRGLLTDEEVNTCKSGMNTWAYVGDLNDKPLLTCVYQSDDANNEFLSNPKLGIGEDVYDDDRVRAAQAKRIAAEREAAKVAAKQAKEAARAEKNARR